MPAIAAWIREQIAINYSSSATLRRPISAGCQHFAAAGFYSGPRRTQRASGWLAGLDTNFVTRCHNEWFFTRAMYRRVFLGTGLFLFFWYLLPERPETDRRQPGAVGDLYYLGTRYFSGGVPDGRHFGGTSEPRGHRRPVAVCLLPGQKSGALYRGSGRRRVWRRRAGLDTLQHPVYAI